MTSRSKGFAIPCSAGFANPFGKQSLAPRPLKNEMPGHVVVLGLAYYLPSEQAEFLFTCGVGWP